MLERIPRIVVSPGGAAGGQRARVSERERRRTEGEIKRGECRMSNLARIYGALCKTAFLNSAIYLTLLLFALPRVTLVLPREEHERGRTWATSARTCILATFVLINPFYPQTKYFRFPRLATRALSVPEFSSSFMLHVFY